MIGGGGAPGFHPSMRGHHARARWRRARLAWLVLVVAALVLGAVVVAGGLLRRSVVLDLVSFWPGWILTSGVVLVHWRASGNRHRFPGYGLGPMLPFSLMGWLVVVLVLHLAGWELLPSSADRLGGPVVTDRMAAPAIDVRLEGVVIVQAGADLLYEVSSLASSGAVAPPEGEEFLTGDDFEVRLREGPEAGWFGSSGWNLALNPGREWAVAVSAAEVEADLRELSLRSLRVEADGVIRLGPARGDVPASLTGDLVVELPAEVSVELSGPVTVGSGWEATADGKRYRGDGAGRYLIEVDPDSDVVVNQS